MRRALLWLYPRGWRQEYGPELLAILRAAPLTPGILADVIRHGIRERLRELGAAWLMTCAVLTAWTTGACLLSRTPQLFPVMPLTLPWFPVLFGYSMHAVRRQGHSPAGAALRALAAGLVGLMPWIAITIASGPDFQVSTSGAVLRPIDYISSQIAVSVMRDLLAAYAGAGCALRARKRERGGG